MINRCNECYRQVHTKLNSCIKCEKCVCDKCLIQDKCKDCYMNTASEIELKNFNYLYAWSEST